MSEPLFALTWDYAPDWAQWFAFDKIGFGCWYEEKPDIEEEGWLSDGRAAIVINIAAFVITVQKETIGWKDSLRQRPS